MSLEPDSPRRLTRGEEWARSTTWIGLDVGKTDHHATVIDPAGSDPLTRGVLNDEQAIERLLDAAGDGRRW